ncbi:hypothetical protein H6G27_26515 [Nostoc linckia FACHB-104]|nr:hypothetical protein [Nostoc linckia FACHB-104]
MKEDKWRYGSRVQIYVPTQDDVEAYKAEAHKRGMTLSQLMRTATEAYINSSNGGK